MRWKVAIAANTQRTAADWTTGYSGEGIRRAGGRRYLRTFEIYIRKSQHDRENVVHTDRGQQNYTESSNAIETVWERRT